MKRRLYLFTFAYEPPALRRANEALGDDEELTAEILVSAEDTEGALAAGRRVAQRAVERLFEREGKTVAQAWSAHAWANWISAEEHQIAEELLETAPVFEAGEAIRDEDVDRLGL